MSALAPLLADAALRGTLVLLAALAATAAMRRASASARHLVWLAALAALLLLPLARAAVPEWRVLPRAPEVLATGAAAPVAAAGTRSTPAAPPAAGEGAVAAAGRAGPAPAARLPLDAPQAALLLWGAGAALLLLRLASGVARVRWIEWRAREVSDPEWVRTADALSRRLGLGRIVRLLRHDAARVPMTWGVLRPVVLLPAEADGWDAERRRVVLAHELAHVRRWDALTQWVGHLALALFWFHPLVWFAARRLREERERACDDAVLEIGTRPAAYAEHLLTLVRSLGRAPAPAAALAMARRSHFEGRLLAILDGAARRGGVSRAAALATGVAALACLLPLAALRPAEAAPVREPSASAPVPAPAPAGQGPAPAEAPRTAAPEPRPDTTRSAPAQRREVDEILAGALRAGSDTEKRRAVARAMAHPAFATRSDVPDLLVDVLRGMTSPIEQRRILTALWRVRQWDESCLVTLLRHAGGIASDAERRRILTGAAAAQRLGGDARRAYRAAAESIAGATDRRAALRALDGDGDAGGAHAGADRQPGESKWNSDLEYVGTRDGRPRSMRLRATDVFFRTARSAPHRIGPGGELYLEEHRDGSVRVLRARPGERGEPVYAYTVDGAARPFDTAARDWMAALIREVTGS